MSIYLALLIVAGVLAFIGVAESRGHNLAAWAALVLSVALVAAR